MEELPVERTFLYMEPGPIVFITTNDGSKDNVMCISWNMVTSFKCTFAIMTGPWNYSWKALVEQRECVIGIVTVDLIDPLLKVGTCSGRDTDKFSQINLTPVPSKHVRAPSIRECYVNIECKVTAVLEEHHLVLLKAVGAHIDNNRKETRKLHAVGDGKFIVDGETFDRYEDMPTQVPKSVGGMGY